MPKKKRVIEAPHTKTVYYLCTAHLMTTKLIHEAFSMDNDANPRLMGINCMEGVNYVDIDEHSCDSDEIDFILQFRYSTDIEFAKLTTLASNTVGDILRSEHGESSTFEIEREVLPVTNVEIFNAK